MICGKKKGALSVKSCKVCHIFALELIPQDFCEDKKLFDDLRIFPFVSPPPETIQCM